jgi:hypothetical protein
MTQSATDIVRDVINAAIVDAIVALKDASQGLPNALMRDLAAIHANTAFGDLPLAVQKAVAFSVRDAFSKLQKNGYVIAEAKSVSPAAPRPASLIAIATHVAVSRSQAVRVHRQVEAGAERLLYCLVGFREHSRHSLLRISSPKAALRSDTHWRRQLGR